MDALVLQEQPPEGFAQVDWNSTYVTVKSEDFAATFPQGRLQLRNEIAETRVGNDYKILFPDGEGLPLFFATRLPTEEAIRANGNIQNLIYISHSIHVQLHKRGLVTLLGGTTEFPALLDAGGEAGGKALNSPDDVQAEHSAYYRHRNLPSLLKAGGAGVKMNVVVALFYPLPSFLTAYAGYTYHPDEGVIIDTGASLDGGESVEAPQQGQQIADGVAGLSRNTRLAVAFMAAIAMTKTFTNAAQYRQVMEKRIEALSYALGDDSISPAVVKAILPPAVCKAINRAMAFRPKLKSAMCLSLMDPSCTFHEHARMILKETNMTAFTLIYEFIFGEKKTAAHLDVGVLTQMKEWLKVFYTLQAKYGLNWPYYRLLEPKGEMIYSRKWRRLAKVAVAYAAYHRGGTYARMAQARELDQKTLTLVAAEINPEHLIDVQDHHLDAQTFAQLMTVIRVRQTVPLARADRPDNLYVDDIVDEGAIDRILTDINRYRQEEDVEVVGGGEQAN